MELSSQIAGYFQKRYELEQLIRDSFESLCHEITLAFKDTENLKNARARCMSNPGSYKLYIGNKEVVFNEDDLVDFIVREKGSIGNIDKGDVYRAIKLIFNRELSGINLL